MAKLTPIERTEFEAHKAALLEAARDGNVEEARRLSLDERYSKLAWSDAHERADTFVRGRLEKYAGANVLSRSLRSILRLCMLLSDGSTAAFAVAASERRALEKRIEALEASALTDGGIFKEGSIYRPNQICTFKGSPWICLQATDSKPPAPEWRQMARGVR